jgi:hypothetical protein
MIPGAPPERCERGLLLLASTIDRATGTTQGSTGTGRSNVSEAFRLIVQNHLGETSKTMMV